MQQLFIDWLRDGAAIFVAWYLQFLLIAGGTWLVVWVLGRERFAAARIQQQPRRPTRIGRELLFSTLSIVIFAGLLAVVLALHRQGWTRIYTDIAAHGWTWLVLSVAVMALVHDTYYYFAHRAMHHPRVFRHVHRLHHEFSQPTPFASYAFHPWEALVEVAWFLPLALVLPLHPLAVGLYVVLLTVLNVVSHLGHEFYPPALARWVITSTHHNLHHSRGRGHYMLYFNLWDRWLGSNHDDYEAQVRAIRARARAAAAARRDASGSGLDAALPGGLGRPA